MVANLDSKARSYLELPLAWHDFSVGSGDLDSGIKTSLVVGIGDGSAEANVATNRAVVWALVSRVACGGPAVWLDAKAGLLLQQRIFLFNTVPRFFILTLLENRRGEGSEVGVGRDQGLEIVVLPAEGLTKHEDVVALSEGIREEGARFEDDFRVFSCGLVR